jgi:GNAT superfamily N-acetyltransferase
MHAETESSARAGASHDGPGGNGRDGGLTVVIRPFAEDDYPVLVDIVNRSYPEYGDTEAEWRFGDSRRNPQMKFARFVGEVDGRVAAVANYEQWENMYHPRRFAVDVTVDPERRRRGIGAQMYAHLWAVLAAHDPMTLHAQAREDYLDSVRFLERRGFRDVMRAWESRLDLQAFDAAPYAEHLAAFRASGLKAATIDQLAGDPDRDRKLYDLVDAVGRDVPSPEPHTSVDFDLWVERNMKSPDLLPCLYWVALDGDRYVGLSNMWGSQHDPLETYTGLTGTLGDYRRRGIALALKVLCIARARELGYRQTRTWNETGNEGMLAINVRLGFVRQPAWVTFAKEIAAV